MLFRVLHFLEVPERLDEFAEGDFSVLVEIKVADKGEYLRWISTKLDGDGSQVVIVDKSRTVTIKELEHDSEGFQIVITRHLLSRVLHGTWSVVIGAQD